MALAAAVAVAMQVAASETVVLATVEEVAKAVAARSQQLAPEGAVVAVKVAAREKARLVAAEKIHRQARGAAAEANLAMAELLAVAVAVEAEAATAGTVVAAD